MDLSILTCNFIDFNKCYVLKLYLLDLNIAPSIYFMAYGAFN